MKSFPGIIGLAIALVIVWISINGVGGAVKSIDSMFARAFSVSAATK